jgi:hypothetical protein
MLFSPDALKRPNEHDSEGPARAEKGRLVNVQRRKRRKLSAPRFLLTLLSK